MKLRLGEPVAATDGHFGQLGDIVVDPQAAKVTHIVVEPEQSQHQERLVPIWLVSDREGSLVVELDTAHLRQLERVSVNDFVRPGETIELEDDWDIGIEEVLHIPYVDVSETNSWMEDRIEVRYDRIPKGECEIRRASRVTSADGETVGHVEAFIADGDDLTAIVVRSGRYGFRRNVLVPFASVARVRNDHVELGIDEETFSALPRTGSDSLDSSDSETGLTDLRALAEQGGNITRKAADNSAKALQPLWAKARAFFGEIRDKAQPPDKPTKPET
jgi:sporulation protein YlmC with PRC-barrel domain